VPSFASPTLLRRAAVCGLLAVPLAATPALGATVSATGVGRATVRVTKPLSQEKIARAVDKARFLATPRALTNATAQASRYAEAGGFALGNVLSIEEPAPNPYGYYGPYGSVFSTGRFGPNKYCGKVTTVKRRLVNGKRRVVARRTRFQCFKPEYITVSLYVEFNATPLTPSPAA
jgi:hypothetical protein